MFTPLPFSPSPRKVGYDIPADARARTPANDEVRRALLEVEKPAPTPQNSQGNYEIIHH